MIRIIRFNLPDPQEFGIGDNILRLAEYNKGLVLVTGPAGSGKSTTLACLIDAINSTKSGISSHWKTLWSICTGTKKV